MKFIIPTTLCLTGLAAALRQVPLGNPTHDGLAITVRASPTVSHVAEIAKLDLVLSATATDDAAASASASSIDAELRGMVKSYDAAIEKWTATQITSGKRQDDDLDFIRRRCRGKDCDSSDEENDGKKEVSASYTLEFTDLKRLSAFTTEIDELAGVKIDRVGWELTEESLKILRAEMRCKAVKELSASAEDYKEAFGFQSVTPVDLHEDYFFADGFRRRYRRNSKTQDMNTEIPDVKLEAEVTCKYLTS